MTTIEYRTTEQFEDIRDNVENGNWKDAATIGEAGGWYANDLLTANDEAEQPIDLRDLVFLVEAIQELR